MQSSHTSSTSLMYSATTEQLIFARAAANLIICTFDIRDLIIDVPRSTQRIATYEVVAAFAN